MEIHIYFFCKLYHSFTLDKPSFSWGSFSNDLHWNREHLQIICSKKNILFLTEQLFCVLWGVSKGFSHALQEAGLGTLSSASVLSLGQTCRLQWWPLSRMETSEVKNQVGFSGESARRRGRRGVNPVLAACRRDPVCVTWSLCSAASSVGWASGTCLLGLRGRAARGP